MLMKGGAVSAMKMCEGVLVRQSKEKSNNFAFKMKTTQERTTCCAKWLR
jgi:hypothetical protein